MSASAFLAGVAVGGVRYGYVKFQLHERENVVQFSIDAVKQHFRGQPKAVQRADERYVVIPSREHEYYTAIRESWNSKVLCFRNTVLDILQVKNTACMTSSSSSTYFQGGDYVELLSAQGKAPAATWKLHGKILKSFEKGIKGNAFQLDGSTETKMQLPKTAITHSLGLSQRFVVFQLAIPFTRSFSIEIGFSDFQKIRRRFVFASAFRETAMTSLHVQIPFDARVTRDQWINLVFDLQALTETYFPGSTFRSMESICISGSCKLKRVFTMKDAPTCNLAALQQQQLVVKSNGKPAQRGAMGVMMPVASYADMKDIPKQFLFSSGGPGPIPTEYFVLTSSNAATAYGEPKESATASNKSGGGGSSNGSAAVSTAHARGQSAPVGAQKQKASLVKKARPVSSSSATTRPGTVTPRVSVRSDVQEDSPPSSPPVTWERDQGRRPVSSHSVRSSSQESPVRQNTPATSVPHSTSSYARLSPPKETSARPPSSSSYKREVEQHGDHVLQPGIDARSRSSSSKKTLKIEKFSSRHRCSDGNDDAVMTPHVRSPRPSSSFCATLSMELRPLHRSSSSSEIKTSKEVHRRAIIAEIQQKLDILSDDDELEAERNTKMFLQRTSTALDSPPQLSAVETHHLGDSLQHGDSDDQQDSRGDSERRRRVHSSGPKLTRKSIFAFADASDSDEDGGEKRNKLEMKKQIAKLFDFESLLLDSSAIEKQDDAVTSTTTKEQVLETSALSSTSRETQGGNLKPNIVAAQSRNDCELSSDDEEDQALAQMLIAKRNARRQQQMKAASEKQMQLTQSLEVTRSSRSDQRKLSVDDLTPQEQDEEEELHGVSEIQFAAERSHIDEQTVVDRNYRSDSEGDGDEDQEDVEDNLSIDLTGDLDDDGESDEGEGDTTEVSRSPSAQLGGDAEHESDTSFNFDDLVDGKEDEDDDDDRVEDEKRQQSLVFASSSLQRSNNAASGTTTSSVEKRRNRIVAKEQEEDETVAFSTSSPRKSLLATSNHEDQLSNELSFSSSRRLARLLESTDWSQLQEQSEKSTTRKKTLKTTRPGGLDVHAAQQGGTRTAPPSSATRTTSQAAKMHTSAAASLELIYDPLLNCYFDPVANKYYALASE